MAETPKPEKKNRHAEWTRSKLERAAQDEFTVISQKTRDTSAYVNLLNTNDNLMYALRMNVGHRPGLTLDMLMVFMDRAEAIKQELNSLNEDLCKALGREYRPPRGFKPKKSQVVR